jgi:hypothetical protein
MGRPEEGPIVFQTVFIKTVYLLNRRWKEISKSQFSF